MGLIIDGQLAVSPTLLTEEQTQAMMPKIGARAALFLPHLLVGLPKFGITAPLEMAGFMAQLGHESGDLSKLSEDLDYSAERMAVVWPGRFANADGTPNASAKKCEHNPQALANVVYANRGGNGDEASGDGWRCRGSGGIQITFMSNHVRVAKFFGKSIAEVGDWMRTPEGAVLSACWFWWSSGCAKPALAGDFDQVCDIINLGHHTEKQGDAIGFADRKARFDVCCKVLGC